MTPEISPSRPAGPLALFRRMTKRQRTVAVSAVPVVALFAVGALAPLPFALAQPGITADVVGKSEGKPVITVDGEKTRQVGDSEGKLLMTTIGATPPGATVRLPQVVDSWVRTDRAAMPVDAVYPVGDDIREIQKYNKSQMRKSQDDAVRAALRYLNKSPKDVEVALRLADVGGPSAGLFFSLGIIDKLGDDALTGGKAIAGTGTIEAGGEVGPVGGVPLKTRAAKRDGATVFLVPRAECAEAKVETPKGLRLVPVDDLKGAVAALKALKDGKKTPSC